MTIETILTLILIVMILNLVFLGVIIRYLKTAGDTREAHMVHTAQLLVEINTSTSWLAATVNDNGQTKALRTQGKY